MREKLSRDAKFELKLEKKILISYFTLLNFKCKKIIFKILAQIDSCHFS